MKLPIEILRHRLTILQEGLPLMSNSFDKFYTKEEIAKLTIAIQELESIAAQKELLEKAVAKIVDLKSSMSNEFGYPCYTLEELIENKEINKEEIEILDGLKKFAKELEI